MKIKMKELYLQIHSKMDNNEFKMHLIHNGFYSDRDTIILIHGYLGTINDYKLIINNFGSDYNIIAVDLRGHGKSEYPYNNNWSVSDLSYDIFQVIDQMIPRPFKVNIVASSLGTAIALDLVKKYPDYINKLLLISPTNQFEMSFFRKIMRKLGDITPATIVNLLLDIFSSVYPLIIPDKNLRDIIVNGFENIKRMDMYVHKQILEITIPSWDIDVSNIKNPILIIAGEDDTIVPFYNSMELNNALQNSTLVSIPNIKHHIIKKQPQLISDILDDWLTCHACMLRLQYHLLSLNNF